MNQPSRLNQAQQLAIIVLERTGRWTSSLRSTPFPNDVRLFEFRTLEHVTRQLDETLASIVCLETTPANVPAVYRWLWTVGENYPWARFVVLDALGETAESVPADMGHRRAIGDLLREAGAIYSIRSTRDVDRLLPIVSRYLSNSSFVTLNSGEMTAAERILADLSWSDS